MSTLLKKLKFVDQFDYKIELDHLAFVESMNKIVDKGNSSDFFSRRLDKFVDGENNFIGEVSDTSFAVRKRSGLFNNSGSLAIGEITSTKTEVTLNVKITAFNTGNSMSVVVILLAYLAGMIFFYAELGTLTAYNKYFTPLFVCMVIVMFFLLRSNVKGLRDDLEWEFFEINRKAKAAAKTRQRTVE